MEKNDTSLATNRRTFLGTLATGAAAVSLGGLAAPIQAAAKANHESFLPDDDPDAWFNKIQGKHRVVFDCTHTFEVFQFAWPTVFMMTNEATGTPAKDQSVVVVLRHEAVGYAFNDKIWSKYNLASLFKIQDLGPAFKAAAFKTGSATTRNPFLNTKEGDFQIPGIGSVPLGINDLQSKGVMICACNAATTVYSAIAAMMTGANAADVKKEWTDNLIPGIQLVPSGVWAVGRAQEHKCAYVFVG